MAQRLGKLLTVLQGLLVRDTWSSTDRCDVLFFSHDSHRSVTWGERAYAPILDSILDELTAAGWVCRTIGQADSVLVGVRAHAGPKAANRAFFAARVKRAARRLVRVRAGDERNSDSASEALYGRMLDRTGCRCVIAIGTTPAMCRAARARGVKVVEVLHGIGYGMIPWDWATRASGALPTAVLCLDPVSTRTLAPLRERGMIVREIAHPWLTRFKSPSALLPDEWTRKLDVPEFARKAVLVSLQWGYDGEFPEFAGILPNGVMPQALIDAIRDTRESVFWLLRLHPIQSRGKEYARHRAFVAELGRSSGNCEWLEASRRPLPALLKGCDGHVTMSSMTTYEAAYMGVPTLLLCPTLGPGGTYSSYFADLLASGHAQRSRGTSGSIAEWVRSVERRDKVSLGAGETAVRVIRDILGTHQAASAR